MAGRRDEDNLVRGERRSYDLSAADLVGNKTDIQLMVRDPFDYRGRRRKVHLKVHTWMRAPIAAEEWWQNILTDRAAGADNQSAAGHVAQVLDCLHHIVRDGEEPLRVFGHGATTLCKGRAMADPVDQNDSQILFELAYLSGYRGLRD